MAFAPDGAPLPDGYHERLRSRSWLERIRLAKPSPSAPPRAFGWLAPEQPYRTGPCPAAVRGRLEEAARHPVRQTRGYHECEMCPPREYGGLPYRTGSGDELSLGSASIELCVGGQRWEAPNLVLHYITEHDYLPPDEIVEDTLTNWHPGQGEG